MPKKFSEMNNYEITHYRILAMERYKLHVKTHDSFQKLHHEYGKWLISSLMLANAGAIIGIATTGNSAEELYRISGIYFLWGLGLSFAAGAFAWMNVGALTDLYWFYVKPDMLYGPDWDVASYPNDEQKRKICEMKSTVDWTFKTSVTVGIASFIFLIVGAYLIWKDIS